MPGKTTAFNLLTGVLRPTRGRIRLDGRGLTGAKPETFAAAGIAHCLESRQILVSLSVEESLGMGAFLRRDTAVTDDFTAMGNLFPILRERADGLAEQLSGGEQMMLAIARALMSRPRLPLLDEPSLGLAPRLVETIFDVISDIREHGVTVLLVEFAGRAELRHDARDRRPRLRIGEWRGG